MAARKSRVPVFLFFIIIVSFPSCLLVKENRDNCPCRLEIQLSGTHGAVSRVLVSAGEESWNFYAGRDTVLSVYVPKGRVSVTAWSGAEEPLDGVFLGTSGGGFPPLFLCHCALEARGEEIIAHARLRKQFCTLSVGMEGPPGWGRPIGTNVRGNVSGMDIFGGTHPGSFNCVPGKSAGGWSMRIPRQDPDSPLLLDIVMADSVVRTFSLGSYLKEAGFDWSAPDLGDIDIRLNLSVTSLAVRAPTWESEAFLSIDI